MPELWQLEGDCNKCGICCYSLDGNAHCENLDIVGWPGDEDATKCKVWDTRYHGMPIRMVNYDGSLAYESKCAVFSEEMSNEKFRLPKECSYKLIQIENIR